MGVVGIDTGVVGAVVVGVGVVSIEDCVVGNTVGVVFAGSALVTVVDGVVLAIALDEAATVDDVDVKDSEVAEGTSEEVATGALVAILVLLEDIVNCLTTNFLGFLYVAILVTNLQLHSATLHRTFRQNAEIEQLI